MKSITSCSERPCASCSRTARFRSSASCACESAMVWFWHTRQRNCPARWATRASNTASGAAPALPASSTARHSKQRGVNPMDNLNMIQLPYQRQQFFAYDLLRDRSDVLMPDHAALVDHEGLRHAVHAVFDADLAVAVVRRHHVGIAELAQPA